MADPLPVVVVGAGPTGLTAALLLARRGVRVVVLERHTGVHPLPRAVHLDDEVYRVLQSAGVGEAFAAISRPAAGLRLVDGRHRVMAEFGRPATGRHGLPQANTFDQPDLEQLLRAELARCPQAELREGVEVLGVDVPRPAVRLRQADGRHEELAAAAVLGCDGAHSVVRDAVGARWLDLHFEEGWLVVDTRSDRPLSLWPGVHQVCDGRRAATFLQVGADRYRWEFRLPTDREPAQLLEPWLRSAPGAQLEVLRTSAYTFQARLADRWRRDRVFLLGDAAHLTPPFIGQGVGLGLRDAANLTWKLARVLQGAGPEALLDTYEPERRPHARALIRTAVVAGWAMTGGQGPAAAVRRLALAALVRVPAVRDGVLDRGSPPLAAGPLVPRRRGLVGTLAPQPDVVVAGRVRRLDEVLGDGFGVLTTATPDAALRQLAGRLQAPLLRAGPGALARWLAAAGVSTAVLRPDRVVLLTARSAHAPGAELLREGAGVLARV